MNLGTFTSLKALTSINSSSDDYLIKIPAVLITDLTALIP